MACPLTPEREEVPVPVPSWPSECEEARRTFTGPGAHLLPLIGGYVHVGERTARLVNVLNDLAHVVYDTGPRRVRRVPVEEVSAGSPKSDVPKEQ